MTRLEKLNAWAATFPNFPSRLQVQEKIAELLAEEPEIEATAETLRDTFQKLTARNVAPWAPTRDCHCALCRKEKTQTTPEVKE